MSKSMSRTVLWSWLRGTEEGGDTGLDKGLMPILHFSDAAARGYCLALCHESARRNQCHGLVSSSAGKPERAPERAGEPLELKYELF